MEHCAECGRAAPAHHIREWVISRNQLPLSARRRKVVPAIPDIRGFADKNGDSMKMQGILAALCIAFLGSANAIASDPVKLVVGYSAGASLDALARAYAEQVRVATGGALIVENKPGANGYLSAQVVSSADGDGKTLLFASDTIATVNPILYTTSKFDVSTLAPVGMIALQSSILVVRADSRIANVRDFVEAARERGVTYASAGPGSSGHLVMSYFLDQAATKSTHIPYKGGLPAVLAVLGGEVDGAFLATGNVLPQIQQGKLKALAVTSAQRLSQLPQVPTMKELGYKDFVLLTGALLMVPKRTSPEIQADLASQIKLVTASRKFQQNVERLGMEVSPMSAAETAKWLAREHTRWAQVIRAHQIKVD
jgi:tripartite-type tricarboxylate transporter receptor subunit TctC